MTTCDNAKNTGGSKVIRNRDFGRRLSQACDGNPHVPAPHYGRLGWVQDQLEMRGLKTSEESVRRWLSGEARPRPDKIRILADVFSVDEAWLATGRAPDLEPKQKTVRNAEVAGAVNLVAGVIQMAGGHPAFPKEGEETSVDLYAIIRGAKYEFKIVLAQPGKDLRFIVPSGLDGQIVIGVVVRHDHCFDFFEIEPEIVAEGKHRGGYVEVATSPEKLRLIKTFSERL